jgi:hypothetical protein
MTHDDQYGWAQQQVNNYQTQRKQGTVRPLPGYNPLARGSADDRDLRAFVTAEFADIPDMFTAFAIPDPDACQPMVDALLRSAATLQPALSLMAPGDKLYTPLTFHGQAPNVPVATVADAMAVRMRYWTGAAAEAFDTYLSDFGTSTGYQRDLAVALAITLQSQLEIKRRMLSDIWTVGEKTIKTLEALDRLHCPTKGTASLTLTIVGAIAAIVVAAAESELLVGIGIAEGVGAGGSVLSTSGPFTVSQPLGGATVPEVIGSMREAMNRVASGVDDQQRQLVDAVRKLEQEVDSVSRIIQLQAPLGDVDLMSATAGDLGLNGRGLFYSR